MSREKLSEFLAVEVMGWHKGETWTWRKFNTAYFNSEKYDPNLASDEQTNYIMAYNWSPPTNIEQAMMLLERSRKWDKITNSGTDDGSSTVSVLFAKWGHAQMDHENDFPMAASLAVARAHGYED